MDRRPVPTKDRGDLVVREPSRISDPRPGEGTSSRWGVPDPIDSGPELERSDRLDEEFIELRRPLLIPPIPDPDEVAHLVPDSHRSEEARVGRLMPTPDPLRPSPLPVYLAEGLTEGEDHVVLTQVIARQDRKSVVEGTSGDVGMITIAH